MDRYEALQHAVKAHGATPDKCGQLYVLHPLAVARAVEDNTNPDSEWHEDGAVVALLHDVLEDTDYPLPERTLNVPQHAALKAVTKDENETYASYIEQICACPNQVAIIVKLADLWHNLQPIRQRCLAEGEARGLEKRYLKSRNRLWEALGQEWWPYKEGAPSCT